MFHDLLRIPIVTPSVLVPVDVLAALLVVAVVVPTPRRHLGADTAADGSGRWRRTWRPVALRIAAMVVAAAVGVVVVWWVGDVQDAFGVDFTPVTRMWVALTFAAVGLLVVAMIQGRNGRRGLAVVATLCVTLAAALGVNVDFGAYRTIEQAIATNPYPQGTLGAETGIGSSQATVVTPQAWHAPASMPRRGKTISVKIPATSSHFHARRAVVYLPPAARTVDPPVLPVLISLSGQPGQPSDMFQAGRLGAVMDAYAAAHHGLAPIVVAPDQLGAPNRNPMCVDSRRLGKSATYIMTDTTRWIRSHLNVGSAPTAWGIVGFSQGATCAMQFSSEYPEVFGTTFAISSELAPFTGSVTNSADVAFHGSVAAYRAAAPIAVMRKNAPYTGHLTVFAYGSDDAPYRKSTGALRAAADAAGMQTSTIVSPGTAHDWNTVRYSLRHGMSEVIAHLGLR
jgi:enterochelin esterase-like enzyme